VLEVTVALHSLEDRTVALEWPVIRRVLERELGRQRLVELDIDPVPIGAASLGQVHLARRLADDRALCLKVQYPGVADSIDADIDAVVQMLEIARMIAPTEEFRSWLEEVREISRKMRADIWDDVAAGKLNLPVDSTFGLDDVVAAQEHMAKNRHFGKILLEM